MEHNVYLQTILASYLFAYNKAGPGNKVGPENEVGPPINIPHWYSIDNSIIIILIDIPYSL